MDIDNFKSYSNQMLVNNAKLLQELIVNKK